MYYNHDAEVEINCDSELETNLLDPDIWYVLHVLYMYICIIIVMYT